MENGRELISRLVRCGFTESNATDICQKYASVKIGLRWNHLFNLQKLIMTQE